MKKMIREFKEFALRGNVMDLAVGMIIGAAFQAIVKSLVDDVISPVIGLFANTDLSYLVLTVGEVEIRYGAFLTAVINFVIMAAIIFLLVKGMNTRRDWILKKTEFSGSCPPESGFPRHPCDSRLSGRARIQGRPDSLFGKDRLSSAGGRPECSARRCGRG